MDTNKEKYSFEDFIEIIDELRGENGCEWDKAQTFDTLTRYLIEEAYEYIEAEKQKDYSKMADELGDVFLQIALNSRIAKEKGKFDIYDVIDKVSKKMIYRHPHVFNRKEEKSVDEVLEKWDELKKKESDFKSDKEVLLHISKGLPALQRAEKVIKKLKKLDKMKKNTSFDKESIDKLNNLLDNNKELVDNINEKEAVMDAFINLIYIATEKDIPLEIALNDKTDELIERFN